MFKLKSFLLIHVLIERNFVLKPFLRFVFVLQIPIIFYCVASAHQAVAGNVLNQLENAEGKRVEKQAHTEQEQQIQHQQEQEQQHLS